MDRGKLDHNSFPGVIVEVPEHENYTLHLLSQLLWSLQMFSATSVIFLILLLALTSFCYSFSNLLLSFQCLPLKLVF
jgi:hypothetical protein